MKDFIEYKCILKDNFSHQLKDYINEGKMTIEKLFNEKLRGFIDFNRVTQDYIFPKLSLTLGETPQLIPIKCEQPYSISVNNKISLFNNNYNKKSDQKNWLCFNEYVQSFDGNFDIKVISSKSILDIFHVEAPFAVFIDVIQERHNMKYYEYHKLTIPNHNDVRIILIPNEGYTLEEFLSTYFKEEVIKDSAAIYVDDYLTKQLNQIKLEL